MTRADAAGQCQDGDLMRMQSQPEVTADLIEIARRLQVYVDAYLEFPTQRNGQLVCEQVGKYQSAWINERAMAVRHT